MGDERRTLYGVVDDDDETTSLMIDWVAEGLLFPVVEEREWFCFKYLIERVCREYSNRGLPGDYKHLTRCHEVWREVADG